MTDTRGRSSTRVELTSLAWNGVALAIGFAGVVVAARGFQWAPSAVGGDAWNYLAAGERLNAGHLLYALGPGDRPVPLEPPYWSVPLLAPPPIAVLWRALAVAGEASMSAWGIAVLLGTAVTAAWLARRSGRLGRLALAMVAMPLTLAAMSGNAAGLVVPLLAAAWTFRTRPWIAGTCIAIACAVKLTPAVFFLWLIGSRRWNTVAAALAATVVLVAVSVIGAGPDSWFQWARSVPGSAPSPLAIATLMNAPSWLVALGFAAATLAASVAFGERVGFVTAVVAAALATPALYFQALALLAAAVAALEGPRWVPALPRRVAPTA